MAESPNRKENRNDENRFRSRESPRHSIAVLFCAVASLAFFEVARAWIFLGNGNRRVSEDEAQASHASQRLTASFTIEFQFVENSTIDWIRPTFLFSCPAISLNTRNVNEREAKRENWGKRVGGSSSCYRPFTRISLENG